MKKNIVEEFLGMLGLDNPQENKSEEAANVDEEIAELVVELLEEIKLEKPEVLNQYIECRKAREECFEEIKDDYHQAIANELRHGLIGKEMKLVDIAFRYAFMAGWESHKYVGGNNDK